MSASRELTIGQAMWGRLVGELHRRTENESHESGAFLLGHLTDTGRRVTEVLYFDDLHADVHANGVVELPAAAFRQLWAIVKERGVQVVADIHVHPYGAGQSWIDQQNPLIAQRGHIALILPNFARPPIRPEAVGVYVYEGDHRWQVVGGYGSRFLRWEKDDD